MAESSDAAYVESIRTPAQEAWYRYYRADCHVRYHLALAKRWGRLALGSKIALTAFSLFVLVFGLLYREYVNDHEWPKWLGAIGLGGSIVFGYIPFSDWRNTHTVLSQRWNGLKASWDVLRRDMREAQSTISFKDRIDALIAEEAAIESAEPPTMDEKLFDRCQDETDRGLGVGKHKQSA